MRPKLLFVLAGIALLALMVGYFARLGDEPEASARDPGEVLLATRLNDPTGQPKSLAQWRGQVLVVNFWATWCPPCLEEIPAFIRLQERYGPRGVQFVGIAIDDTAQVMAFMQRLGMNYPVLMAQQEGLELARAAGNRMGGLPFTVVIARDGKAARVDLGALNEQKLAPLLERLL